MMRLLACVLATIAVVASPALAVGPITVDEFTMSYTITGDSINFDIACTKGDYVSLTWDASGNHDASDGVTCDQNGCNDISLSNRDTGTTDAQENLSDVVASKVGTVVKATFTRLMTSPDNTDYDFSTGGPVPMKFACGPGNRNEGGTHRNADGAGKALPSQTFVQGGGGNNGGGTNCNTGGTSSCSCFTGTCDAGMIRNNAGVGTTPAQCCIVGSYDASNGGCAEFNCPTVYLKRKFPLPCSGSICDLDKCCSVNAECQAYKGCASGTTQRIGTDCFGKACDRATCCYMPPPDPCLYKGCNACIFQPECTYCRQGLTYACANNVGQCTANPVTQAPDIVTIPIDCAYVPHAGAGSRAVVTVATVILAVLALIGNQL